MHILWSVLQLGFCPWKDIITMRKWKILTIQSRTYYIEKRGRAEQFNSFSYGSIGTQVFGPSIRILKKLKKLVNCDTPAHLTWFIQNHKIMRGVIPSTLPQWFGWMPRLWKYSSRYEVRFPIGWVSCKKWRSVTGATTLAPSKVWATQSRLFSGLAVELFHRYTLKRKDL